MSLALTNGAFMVMWKKTSKEEKNDGLMSSDSKVSVRLMERETNMVLV